MMMDEAVEMRRLCDGAVRADEITGCPNSLYTASFELTGSTDGSANESELSSGCTSATTGASTAGR
jgi:hypothetical protein